MATEGRTTRSALLSPGMITLFVVVAAAVAAIVYYAGRPKAITYFTAAAKVGNITSIVQATGVVEPIHTVAVGAQISGIITNTYADFNTVVKKGDLLALIDPRVYQNALDSANADLANSEATVQSSEAQVAVSEAAVQTAKADLAKAQANVAQMKAQMDRSIPLFQQGIESAQQRDSDVDNYQTADAALQSAVAEQSTAASQLKAAQANVKQAEAVVEEKKSEVQTAQTNLDYCKIYSPVDGVVIQRAVDVGQTVASSLQTPTLFSVATNLDTMWVAMQTDESDEGRLQQGDDATFTVDAYPNTVYHGSVIQQRMFATTVQNVVEYDTIIQFQNPGHKIFPGMTAYVNVPVASAHNVLEVPNSALRFKPSYTPQQLRDKLAQYGMQDTSASTGATASGAGRGGGASSGGSGGGRRGGGHGAAADDSTRPTTTLLWKLDPKTKELIPVRVRTGITDFTNTAITAVLQGELKAGDEVVTGALVPKGTTSGPLGSTPTPGVGGR